MGYSISKFNDHSPLSLATEPHAQDTKYNMQHKIWLPAKERLGYLFCNNLKYTMDIKKRITHE
jgi:hypothetical protein